MMGIMILFIILLYKTILKTFLNEDWYIAQQLGKA